LRWLICQLQKIRLASAPFPCYAAAIMKALLLPILAGLLVTVTPVAAQTDPNTPTQATKDKATNRESDGNHRFWQANLPGGHYMVALDRITAISRHSYAVPEAALLVDEVTVDTVGQGLVRFYFSRPLTEGMNNSAATNLTGRAKELLDYAGQRAGTDLHKMVIKKYPETTHAKEIEYRLLSAEELGALYGSVRTAWDTGRGRVFTIK
jgi:hypothetical protein